MSTILALLVTAAVTLPVPAASPPPSCRDVRFGVRLAEHDATRYRVAGRLCGTDGRLVQVLVAGATEGGLAYWDFPRRDFYDADPATWGPMRDRYSYAGDLADSGYTSLTLDRIGTGFSDHPPAQRVTIGANAFVLHQVVQRLRRAGFEKVVTVGRSLGAAVTYVESVEYGDVDGIISQSFRQHRQPAFATFPQSFEPAQLESRFRSLPPGYITTRPGTRRAFFFTDNADPDVVAHEEATKETLTDAEIPTFAATFAVPGGEVTRSVSVPVLSVVGDADVLFCSGPGCPDSSQEAGFFPSATCFESVVVEGVGHDMNLEPAGKSAVFPVLKSWVAANFAAGQVACGSP